MTEHLLSTAKRLVVKVGSALLVDPDSGMLHQQWLHSLVADVAELRARGQDVVIVTSGSIALGKRFLKLNGQLPLSRQQAAAAVGQVHLVHAYQECFQQHQVATAQILLSVDDSYERSRYLNACNTLNTLLNLNVLPIVNENDTVATSEIRFGDNDQLSAQVAQMIGADTLILLTDIDGLYTADPRKNSTATLISEVKQIDARIEAMAGGASSDVGTGGMQTKLAAAKIAVDAGCRMVISKGKVTHPLLSIDSDTRKTWFVATASPRRARKNWIAHQFKTAGYVVIDAGAVKALKQGKSLLPAGIIKVSGPFVKGAFIDVHDESGQMVARGLSAYNSHDTQLIQGKRGSEFPTLLGYEGNEELIHRNNLVLFV